MSVNLKYISGMSVSVVMISAGLSSAAVSVEESTEGEPPAHVSIEMTPEQEAEFAATVEAGFSAADLAVGQVVYEDYCAACHGYDGINLLPEAPSFVDGKVFESSDSRLFSSVRDGRGEIMPPWMDELSTEEMFSALAFAKKFALADEAEHDNEHDTDDTDETDS